MEDYNTDLIFASDSIANMYKKSIMEPILHTQQRTIQPVIVLQLIRFNLMKVDYSTELDNLIEDVEHIPANCKCVVESIYARIASVRHMPKGCRTEYVTGLTDENIKPRL